MGEGVTNPVRGAASSSPAAADPVSSLLLHVDSSLQLILLLTVVTAVAFRWIFRSRKGSEEPPSDTPNDTELSDGTLGIITNDIDCSDRVIPGQFLADVDEESNSCSDLKDVLNSEIRKCSSTGFCSKSEPRLRWSVGDRQTVFPLQSCTQSPDLLVPILLYNVARCATRRLPGFRMDSSDTPSVPDPQPDSFFTWDSGGSSGEYSFVHTAVELPKYPDGAITEEERQMLLLYMQTGHPELLLTPSQSGHQNGGVQMSENVLCDPVAVRGFLETIVEENSDDLRSPSECDETSLGWGSWDESDEDRLTVVEMVTSTTNDFASGDSVHVSVDDFLNNGVLSEQGKLQLCTGEGVFQEGRQSVDKDEMCEYKDKEIPSRLLSGVKTVNNSSRNVPTFENDSYMDNTISSTQKCEKNSENSSVHNKPRKMDFGSEPGVSSNLNSLNNNGCFDNLWITQNTLDSPSETLNPWTTIDFKEHCEDNNVLTSLDISNPEQIIEGVNPLLVLGSDDICLVPSHFNSKIESENSENLMFSDNFKDYFLPAENYTPAFNKNVPDLLADFLSDDQPDSLTEKPLRCLRIGFGSTITEERSIPSLDASKESHDVDALNDFINGSNCFSTEKSLNNPGNSSLNEDTVRCLRLGFDDESPREEFLFPNAANAPFFNESESLNIFNMEGQTEIQNPNVQEAMFSPLDGDIVYGSTWASSRRLKEPEKTSSGTEVHCSAAQVDVLCEPTILSDSPPPDNNRPASDDDITEVPNSLSRWRHHTDLQHLQEGTSPITRWQHHSSLQFTPEGCKQTTDSEESDDGLPPQLKEIYSSFKMRDNKMGRIRIKEDKNNNFKRLGLWEKESKVTLPPFNSAQSSSSMISPIPIPKEPNSVSKEELDDLEFDMFAVNKHPISQNNVKIAVNGDSDIDDALRSFNHLDDYSSESEDNSDSENCYVVNFREKKENALSEILEIAEVGSSIEDKQLPSSGEMLSLENPCSDNSDNCPLCTDPSFKNSHINDLFSLQNKETLENDVQTLLQKTYPKMVRLSQSNLSDAEVIESNGESNKTGDSISPITTSDSDEGVRVKEVKKRVKKRSKENSSTELKHDDSGYVEDDEDEDDDSLGENSEKLSSGSQMLSTDATNQTRKSLSTAFYESKSNKIEHADPNLPPYAIPETFQEFSKQLELSLSNEEIKAGFMNEERWNIPENLSQFSAWLLDKELKKISNRDEMEKLLVDDMMSLREQTIAKFLKNSLIPDEKLNLKSQDLPSHSDISASVEKFSRNISNIEKEPVSLNLKADFAAKNDINLDIKETEEESLPFVNEDNFAKNAQDSENELPEEYYSYNFNTQVSKIFEDNGNNVDNKTDDMPKEQSLSHSDDQNKLIYVSPTIVESDASSQQSMAAADTNETKLQTNNIEAEITHHLETAISPCDEYHLEYNSSADLCTESSGVEPTENTTQQSNPPSITYQPPPASENTGEIQPKVNDTTIRKEEEKALPDVVNSPQVSTESIPTGNVNIDDSTGEVSEVATSVGRKCNLLDVGTEGVDRDLMTQGVPPGEKGACVGPRADDISTPEAEVVSTDLDGETHVHFNACHAYSLDSRPSDNSDLCVSGAQDIAPELTEKGFGNWSVISDSGIVSGSDKVVGGSEEVECCLPAIVASPPTQEEDSVRQHRGFTIVDYADSPADSVILKEDAASNDDREGLLERDISNDEVGGLSLSNDSELFICDKTLVTHHIGSVDQSDDQNRNFFEHFETKEENSDSNNSKEILDLTENETNSKKPDLIPSDEISEEFETNIHVYRGDYQRSNSLGRDSGEADETFELWNGQSKSTPDLRRCHEQQKKTNAPLSVRLSKSVSQRIEDYLGRNSRDGRLSKSLPPNERSRHYRRICVSTETVVEKAARFEARSKSNCAVRELSEDRSSFSKRSGSCPPSSMRSNTSWISDRSYRNYNKPTATVRPTVDMHRNGMAYRNDLKDCNGGTQNEKENILELITGYTKASKVTHKPPVPPSTVNLQQSLKSARLKGKIANARKDFFERLSQQDLSKVPKRDNSLEDASTPDSSGLRRFDEFRRSAREERARLAASHPDLGALEAAVRSSKRKIDQLKKRNRTTTKSGSQSPLEAGLPSMPSGSSATKDLRLPYRRATGEIAWASCAKRVEEAAAAKRSKGKLAHEQLEIVDGQRAFTEKPAELRAHPPSDHPADPAIADGGNCDFLGTRARSMDFLLDADNRERAQPPENRLGGPGGQTRVKSEHELRIERSLQNLTVPDWYKQSAWSKKPTEGFILRRGSEGSAGESRKRWQGLSSSRTPSTTSLNPPSYSSQRSIVVPKRVTPGGGDWRYAGSLVSSRESLTPASPASLSPRECASAAFQYGLGSSLSRWSSSRLSTSSAPLTALSVHRSFRQPYLGWRAAAASSSGGGSRSSPGTSPINATTPVMQGSRPESPRRGSQEHHYVYGLQQNQITSAATLRPDSAEQPCDSNRISPLALNTTNIFFSSNVDDPLAQQHPQRFGGPEMRRDRYSYTQSLYSGTVIVSPLEDTTDDRRNFNIYEEEDVPSSSRFRIVSSPQPPRVWMESSFVGTKKDGSNEPQVPPQRTIRIIPSDSAGVRTDMFGTVPGASAGASAMRGGTCATQTAMGSFCTNTKPALSLKSIHV